MRGTGTGSTTHVLFLSAGASFNRGVPVLFLFLTVFAATAAPRSGSLIPVTACAAVSRYDVEAALGASVARGTEEYGKNSSTCDFTGRNGLVSISIHRLTEFVSLPAQQQDLRSAFPDAEFQNASIRGATGFYMHLPKAGTQLHLLQFPDRYVHISILGFGEGNQVSKAAASIARKIFDSL